VIAVATFFGLALALTWAIVGPTLFGVDVPPALLTLAGFGPAVAAITVAALTGDLAQLKSSIRVRTPLRWYGLALAAPAAFGAAAVGLGAVVGMDLHQSASALAVHAAPVVLATSLLVIGEELGWRGFAQRHLGRRFGWAVGGALVGLVWAIWHVPIVLSPQLPTPIGVSALAMLAADLVAAGVLYGWLFARTRSVAVATVGHAATNTVAALTPAATLLPVLTAIHWLAAIALVVTSWQGGFRQSGSQPRKEPSMSSFRNVVAINRPVADVFAYLADLRNIPSWNYAIASTTPLRPAPVRVGAEYEQVRTIPHHQVERLVVSGLEPPHRLEITGRIGPFDGRLLYELRAASPMRTELVNTVYLGMSPTLRPLSDLITRRVAAAVAANLDVLASRLNASSPSGANTSSVSRMEIRS
jgi:membrane protease YdiL (CAAX protease family)